jgi:HSP20 family protein
MTYVQLKTQPSVKGFNNFMTDFLPIVKENATHARRPFVNISSTEEGYTIDIFTPGFRKEEFSISFEKNLLTIAGNPECKEDAKTAQKIRNEYQIESFSRSFNVDDKVDGEKISAQYVNGVLTLNLPVKQPVKTPVKQITIL